MLQANLVQALFCSFTFKVKRIIWPLSSFLSGKQAAYAEFVARVTASSLDHNCVTHSCRRRHEEMQDCHFTRPVWCFSFTRFLFTPIHKDLRFALESRIYVRQKWGSSKKSVCVSARWNQFSYLFPLRDILLRQSPQIQFSEKTLTMLTSCRMSPTLFRRGSLLTTSDQSALDMPG